MLSVLAKLKSVATMPSSQMDNSMMEDLTEVDPKETMLQLSMEVDRQFAKLTGLSQGAEGTTAEDKEVVMNIINEYASELASINSSLDELQQTCTEQARETEALLERFNRLLSPQPATPVTMTNSMDTDSAKRSTTRFATPLRHNIHSTPRSGHRRDSFDFDAFPQTPTLEQLGLSKAALDVVGYRRGKPLPIHISAEF